MKILKAILISLYPILIILLLLFNFKGCKENNAGATAQGSQNQQDVSPTENTDTTSVVQQARQTGKSGNLKVTLLWNFQGDIDLHIKQPSGKVINYREPQDTSSGGYLDVDNRNGGNGSAENIYWENPPKGQYQVSLNYFQSSRETNIADNGICSVVVFQQGKAPQTYQVEMTAVGDERNIVTIDIK